MSILELVTLRTGASIRHVSSFGNVKLILCCPLLNKSRGALSSISLATERAPPFRNSSAYVPLFFLLSTCCHLPLL